MKLNRLERRALRRVIAHMEQRQFRTEHDFGANQFAMQMHNYYRRHAGLPFIEKSELPHWCKFHRTYDLCHNNS